MPRSRLCHAALLVLVSVVACDEKPPPIAATPPEAAQTPSASSIASAPSAATASAPARKPVAEAAITTAKRDEYKKALAKGRKLAQTGKWSEAVSTFEASLAANPGDAVVLAELGYAAYHAGDLDKAEATNQKALAAATSPELSAQVLFNQGMVAEKRGDKAGAGAKYEASLHLRPNATVQKRLDALGTPSATPCSGDYPTIEALCACLVATGRDQISAVGLTAEARLACAEKGPRVVPTVAVLRWGAGGDSDDVGEHPWLLAGKAKDGWRRLTPLGTDFYPGAFGVMNGTSVSDVISRVIGGRTVVEVKWTQDNYDANMAGLQADTYVTKNVTICVLGDAPTCPVTVPIEETSATLYPIEPDPEDQSLRDEIEALKKERPPTSETQTATYAISEAGLLKVTETKGNRAFLAPLVAGVQIF